MSVDALPPLRYDERGLVPVVVQEVSTGRVLMLAWANAEALEHTVATAQATYWSRSRGERWVKGETSGHTQRVRRVAWDCDADAVLYLVEQTGPACHTGAQSCFDTSVGGIVPHCDNDDAVTTIGSYGVPSLGPTGARATAAAREERPR